MYNLLSSLKNYKTQHEKENHDRLKIIDLINNYGEECLYRNFFNPGHITASALVMNATYDKVLMNHHKSLKKWLCFGGHVDGKNDILAAALREAQEESGLKNLMPIDGQIVDIDIHEIPANTSKREPVHFHHDISYFLRNDGDEEFLISDESVELRWCTFDEAYHLSGGNNMHRLLDKWHGFACAQGAEQIQQPHQAVKG